MTKLVLALLITCNISAGTLKLTTEQKVKMLYAQLTGKKYVPYSFNSKKQMLEFVAELSRFYALDYKLVSGILRQESLNCTKKLNTVTKDVGCMQINVRNIKARNWNYAAILHNDAVGILAGVLVLREFKTAFSKKEPGSWPCRYNIGYRKLPETCLNYLNKIVLAE